MATAVDDLAELQEMEGTTAAAVLLDGRRVSGVLLAADDDGVIVEAAGGIEYLAWWQLARVETMTGTHSPRPQEGHSATIAARIGIDTMCAQVG